jgi:hypothetical protein
VDLLVHSEALSACIDAISKKKEIWSAPRKFQIGAVQELKQNKTVTTSFPILNHSGKYSVNENKRIHKKSLPVRQDPRERQRE